MTFTAKKMGLRALMLAGVVLLTACGTNTKQSPAVQSIKVARDLLKVKKDSAKSTDKPTIAQLATLALNSNVKGPLTLATARRTDRSSLLALFGTNGVYHTFTTPNRQNVTFNRGLISGTRGLGYDLLSAQINPSVALITSRRAGTAQRIHTYLTVESTENIIKLTCDITRSGAASVPKPTGGSVATIKMVEHCTDGNDSFTNQYWVLSDGYIWKSIQWVSTEYGALVLQTLRR